MSEQISIDVDEVRSIISKAEQSLDEVTAGITDYESIGYSFVGILTEFPEVTAELSALFQRHHRHLVRTTGMGRRGIDAVRAGLADFVEYEETLTDELEGISRGQAGPPPRSAHGRRAV